MEKTCQVIMICFMKQSKVPQHVGLGKHKIMSKHFKFQNSTKKKINIIIFLKKSEF